MQSKLLFPMFLLCFSLLLFATQTEKSYAQKQPDVSISPSIIQLDLSQDAPQTEITYTNNSNKIISLHVTAKDFSAIDDSARFDFLDGQDAKDYHYSLTSWIHIENNDLSLLPHTSGTIKITIDKQRITIGGHYASILTEIQQQTTGPIPVHAIAATLLFVRTGTGNEHEQAAINQVTFLRDFFKFPDKVAIRFKNTGNVQLTPHGLITIKNIFGTTVATAMVNDASSITLPESIRKYTVSLQPTTSILIPGIYTASISLHYGEKNNHQLQITNKFFVISNRDILLGILGSIFLFILIQVRYRKKRHI